MWKDLFSSAALLDLPLIVMLGFMAFFFGAVVWAMSRRRAPHFERMARLPLEETCHD